MSPGLRAELLHAAVDPSTSFPKRRITGPMGTGRFFVNLGAFREPRIPGANFFAEPYTLCAGARIGALDGGEAHIRPQRSPPLPPHYPAVRRRRPSDFAFFPGMGPCFRVPLNFRASPIADFVHNRMVRWPTLIALGAATCPRETQLKSVCRDTPICLAASPSV